MATEEEKQKVIRKVREMDLYHKAAKIVQVLGDTKRFENQHIRIDQRAGDLMIYSVGADGAYNTVLYVRESVQIVMAIIQYAWTHEIAVLYAQVCSHLESMNEKADEWDRHPTDHLRGTFRDETDDDPARVEAIVCRLNKEERIASITVENLTEEDKKVVADWVHNARWTEVRPGWLT